MDKRGQITIFIIIAVIIIAIVAVFFVFREDLIDKNQNSLEIAPIANFVQECIDTTFEDSLYQIAQQGGYSRYSYLEKTNDEGITYYLIEGKNYLPSKSLVEDEIEEYFERKVFLCINQFSNFQDYTIEEGVLESSVNIEEDEIKLKAEYPLTITKGESTTKIEDFESKIQIKLEPIYNSVADFISSQKETDKLCLTCLASAADNNIYVNMTNEGNGVIKFTFKDDAQKLNNKSLEWIFANKY